MGNLLGVNLRGLQQCLEF
uniref:Mitogen-activated protein kinase kinase kinase YODA isoform X1 n=1 Tax=Rhizophora mucronata TaxID=61149 RepID=A0A2P2J522_RHIMU